MKIGVLVSGGGTNLQALLDAERDGGLAPADIAVVVANRADAPALERARRAGKPALVVDHRHHASRESFEDALLEALAQHGAEAIVLAGFMRILTRHFLARFPDRVLNVHPALLPAFPGAAAQHQALEYGVKLTGCTVHFVDETVDGGAIIMQACVEVHADDDEERLRQRILAREHELLTKAVVLLAAGRLARSGRKVLVLP